MYTRDANIFIRDLDTREPDYRECHALLETIQQLCLPMIVPLLLLAEVSGVVSRSRHDAIAGRRAADLLRDRPYMTLVAIDEVLAALASDIAADCGLRGADAISVAVARQQNCVLVTLDREVRERARSIVQVSTPTTVLADLLRQQP